MVGVISQHSGVTRLCVCERQIGPDDSGQLSEGRKPLFANSPLLKGTAPDGLRRGTRRTEEAGIAGRSRLETAQATTSMRLIREDRAEMPNGKRL